MFETKFAKENQNTHFVFNNFFYEKMWENIVQQGRPHVTIYGA
jgi:hypothetical protein